MRKLIIVAIACITVAACAKKKDAQNSEEWPSLESFHMTMAEAYHPYKDSGNLEPARKLASELATGSKAWSAETLPSEIDNDDMRTRLTQLSTDCATLDALVTASAPPDSIGHALNRAHESFHSVMEGWHHRNK